MTRRPAISLLRAAIWPALALFVVAYFAGAAVFGPNGLMSLAGYRAQQAHHQQVLRTLVAERAQLQHRSRLLDPRHANPDMVDEVIRRQTIQIRPDEVILLTK